MEEEQRNSLWLAGQRLTSKGNVGIWGIFTTEDKAISACVRGDSFVMRLELDESHPPGTPYQDFRYIT